MPPIAPLIIPITPLIGAFKIPVIVEKIPPKISTTPCHALLQSPVKTPVRNSMIPLKV